jgi:large subunit ribosomal protein L4
VPKKVKSIALRSALSDRALNGAVFITDDRFGITSEAPSTKIARLEIEKITDAKRVLVLVTRPGENLNEIAVLKSLRNIPSVHLLYVDQINTYDIVLNDAIVFTESALDEFVKENK